MDFDTNTFNAYFGYEYNDTKDKFETEKSKDIKQEWTLTRTTEFVSRRLPDEPADIKKSSYKLLYSPTSQELRKTIIHAHLGRGRKFGVQLSFAQHLEPTFGLSVLEMNDNCSGATKTQMLLSATTFKEIIAQLAKFAIFPKELIIIIFQYGWCDPIV